MSSKVLLDDVEHSLKASVRNIAAILEFQQTLTALNAASFAPKTPKKYTNALAASVSDFDKACHALRLHLLRAKHVLLTNKDSDAVMLPDVSLSNPVNAQDDETMSDSFLNNSLFGDSAPPTPAAAASTTSAVVQATSEKGKERATQDEALANLLPDVGDNDPVDLQAMWSSISASASAQPLPSSNTNTASASAVPNVATTALGLDFTTGSVPTATGLADLDFSTFDFGGSAIGGSSTSGGSGEVGGSMTDFDISAFLNNDVEPNLTAPMKDEEIEALLRSLG